MEYKIILPTKESYTNY